MKDRKLNAYGGRIGYSGGGQSRSPSGNDGNCPKVLNMQQPQMPAGPQPAGIPGGTIVAQNQMQQSSLDGIPNATGNGWNAKTSTWWNAKTSTWWNARDLNLVECQDLWQLKAEELVLV